MKIDTTNILDISKASECNAYITIDNDIQFFIKTFQMPSIDLNATPIDLNAGSPLYMSSASCTYSPIVFMYLVDEMYKNYFYLVNWAKSARNAVYLSDASKNIIITVLNNHKMPIFTVSLANCAITSVGELDFEYASSEPITGIFNVQPEKIYYNFVDGSLSGEF